MKPQWKSMNPSSTGVPDAGVQEEDEASARGNVRDQPDYRLIGYPGEDCNSRFYRRMRFIRRFEERLLDLFEEGLLNGTTHACIGQEADSVGIMDHLRPSDHIFSNHRCHGHYLARTGDAFGLLAEIMGRRAGICGGLGGSQHICAPGFKSNGIQGGIMPAAAGIAMAEQLRRTNNVSLVFVGDGTLGQGIVYEVLNMTALWNLPLFVVVENNGWSQSTPIALHLAGDIAARFAAFGLPVRQIATTDVLEVHRVAGEEFAAFRKEPGPRALVINTYRLCHHSKNDDGRPKDEVLERWKREPLLVQAARLTEEQRGRIESEVDEALDGVVAQARRSMP